MEEERNHRTKPSDIKYTKLTIHKASSDTNSLNSVACVLLPKLTYLSMFFVSVFDLGDGGGHIGVSLVEIINVLLESVWNVGQKISLWKRTIGQDISC